VTERFDTVKMACGAAIWARQSPAIAPAMPALEAAEELVRRKGRVPSAIAVVAAPDGRRALELLSPPGRPVPPEMWAALAASEQALLDDAAAGPLTGPTAAGKRHRPGHNCQPYRHAVPEASAQWSLGSQNSQRSGGEGVIGCEEGGCSQEDESWLDQSFTRKVTPVIPPKDPYLLNVEKWPPGIKFSKSPLFSDSLHQI
jgi:hypothetical protein